MLNCFKKGGKYLYVNNQIQIFTMIFLIFSTVGKGKYNNFHLI